MREISDRENHATNSAVNALILLSFFNKYNFNMRSQKYIVILSKYKCKVKVFMQFLNIWLINDYDICVLFYSQFHYLTLHIYSSLQSLSLKRDII